MPHSSRPSVSSDTSVARRRQPHSLRLRLILWQGTCLAFTLGLLIVGVLVQITITTNKNVEQVIHAEANVAAGDLEKKLLPASPYWPTHLSLETIDKHRDPTLAVQIVDIQGHFRYHSFAPVTISLENTILQAVRSGQIEKYSRTIEGNTAQVQGLPLYAPVKAVDRARSGNAVIGVLFVAKLRKDIDSVLLSLWTPFLLTSLIILTVMVLGSWATASYVLQPLTVAVRKVQTIPALKMHRTRDSHPNHERRSSRESDEVVQMIDAFNELREVLDETTHIQRRFVADASHELRGPLTIIQGNLAFLQQHIGDITSEERSAVLVDAYGETLYLVRLVEDLLLLAHADAKSDSVLLAEQESKTDVGENNQQKPSVELDSLLRQLIQSYHERQQNEESSLKIEIGRIEPVDVYGNEENLRRVMQILLDNALEYTRLKSKEKGEGHITISLERVEQEALVQIRDNGIGIDAVDLPHIFERFYRADHARSRRGTGLGLSIAQTLVEQLDGRIAVESIPDRGSTFSVWLPLT
ncbi:MAG: HAMP domain-containing sensor histidine kinase [Ktedonobacteraceae bacterium]